MSKKSDTYDNHDYYQMYAAEVDIFVAVCREGYYGQKCIRACPAACKSCKPTDGTCSCHAGWMGPNCTIVICSSLGFLLTTAHEN